MDPVAAQVVSPRCEPPPQQQSNRHTCCSAASLRDLMDLFPLADTNIRLSSDPSRDCVTPAQLRVPRTDVVRWWRSALPIERPNAGWSHPSDDYTLSHHQARRPPPGPSPPPASAARCIRRVAVLRSPRRTVAAIAERGP